MVWVFPHGSIEIKHDGKVPFKLNRQWVKYYIGNLEKVKVYVEVYLGKVWTAKATESYHNNKSGAN